MSLAGSAFRLSAKPRSAVRVTKVVEPAVILAALITLSIFRRRSQTRRGRLKTAQRASMPTPALHHPMRDGVGHRNGRPKTPLASGDVGGCEGHTNARRQNTSYRRTPPADCVEIAAGFARPRNADSQAASPNWGTPHSQYPFKTNGSPRRGYRDQACRAHKTVH
jgi:hypothetical protein